MTREIVRTWALILANSVAALANAAFVVINVTQDKLGWAAFHGAIAIFILIVLYALCHTDDPADK